MKFQINDPSAKKNLIKFFFLIAVITTAHHACVNADWMMDDYMWVLGDSLGNTDEFPSLNGGRFIPLFSWWGLNQLFGYDRFWFHLFNLLLHLVSCGLVYWLASLFSKESCDLRNNAQQIPEFSLPFISTLLFGIHPIVTEPLNYAVAATQIYQTQGALLAAISSRLFFQKPNAQQLLFVIGSLIFCNYAKEGGIAHGILSVVFVNSDRINHLNLGSFFKNKYSKLYFFTTIAIITITLWLSNIKILIVDLWQSIDSYLLKHILTQSRVFWEYIMLVFFPYPLIQDRQYMVSSTFADLPATLSLVGIVIIFFTLLYFIFKKNITHKSIPILILTGCAHLWIRFLAQNFEHMVEYRVYTAWCFWSIVAAFGIIHLIKISRLSGYAILVSFVLSSLIYDVHISRGWSSRHKKTDEMLAFDPDNLRLRGNIVKKFIYEEKWDDALSSIQDYDLSLKKMILKTLNDPYARVYSEVRMLNITASVEAEKAYALKKKGNTEAAKSVIDAVINNTHKNLPSWFEDKTSPTYDMARRIFYIYHYVHDSLDTNTTLPAVK
jgi:hypothetical protein